MPNRGWLVYRIFEGETESLGTPYYQLVVYGFYLDHDEAAKDMITAKAAIREVKIITKDQNAQ